MPNPFRSSPRTEVHSAMSVGPRVQLCGGSPGAAPCCRRCRQNSSPRLLRLPTPPRLSCRISNRTTLSAVTSVHGLLSPKENKKLIRNPLHVSIAWPKPNLAHPSGASRHLPST